MKFKIAEDIKQDVQTVEQNSNLQIEFHIYDLDRSNPQADQYVAQLEQQITAMKSENSEQKDESGHPYSMYRLIGKSFNNIQEIPSFFQKDFKNFISILQNIWKLSNNFIRIIIITSDVNPPKRLPGRDYPLLKMSDYDNMLSHLLEN